MDIVKIPASVPYQLTLIESLKAPAEAAAYLSAILEEKEPEPELLPLALKDVLDALAEQSLTSAEKAIQKQSLKTLTNNPEFATHIYALAVWLENLSLKLSITTDTEA